MKLRIIDYGMGNLRSVANAFAALGADVALAGSAADLAAADRVVLPGVGAFGDGMRRLRERGWVEAMEREVREKGKPLLGICLGMQLLAARGSEHGDHAGLGWIAGSVDRLPIGDEDPTVRVPHIGWNDVGFSRAGGLFAGLGERQDFYFVHSYALRPEDPAIVAGRCTHGVEFVAAVEAGPIWATQFHPEKSQRAGLAVLRNFLAFEGDRC